MRVIKAGNCHRLMKLSEKGNAVNSMRIIRNMKRLLAAAVPLVSAFLKSSVVPSLGDLFLPSLTCPSVKAEWWDCR